MTTAPEPADDRLTELVVTLVNSHDGQFGSADADYLLAVVRTLIAEEVEEAADEAESLASESAPSVRSELVVQAEALSRAAAIVRGQIAA